MKITQLLHQSNMFHKLCKSTPNGAGILFICDEDNTALFLLRSKYVRDSNTWGLPGGGLKPNETFNNAAKREAIEELGSIPQKAKFVHVLDNKNDNWIYKIYIVNISQSEKNSWTPTIKLNHEHTDFKWFPLGELPKNLHKAINILAG